MSQRTHLTTRQNIGVALLVLGGFSSTASVAVAHLPHVANSIAMRCVEEPLTRAQGIARTVWAERCGYILPGTGAMLNSMEMYPIFTGFFAPLDAEAPCAGPLFLLGTCIAGGCYPPGERLRFAGTYQSIDHVATSETHTVTSLSENWRVGDPLSLTEQPIKFFSVGDESGDLYIIATTNGKVITVTSTHPMVTGSGEVVPADAVVARHTELYTEDGPSIVHSVNTAPYRGKVWNVTPESKDILANILLAEGFLAGSSRFQNEWAEDFMRLHVRDEAAPISY